MIKSFKVLEAYSGDAMKGLARIHPDDMKALNLSEGDLIELTGRTTTPARIKAGDKETGSGTTDLYEKTPESPSTKI